ncbi:MAG: winged helix-turn-helix domain-containing protein, partial [Pseudomonadota bacterium]
AGARTLADIVLPGGTRDEVDVLSQQQRESTSPETAAQLLELTYRMDATDCISRVTTEVQVLHRTGDRAIPCEAGRRLAASLPGAPFTAFEGRAHPPWFDDGPDIATPVIEFLAGGSGRLEPAAPAEPGPGRYLDTANRRAVIGGDLLPLTPLEYGVMRYLAGHGDRVVSRDELLEHVWKTPIAGSNKVDVLVRALRRKLGADAHTLETVAGHGYRLRGWSIQTGG